MVRSVPSFLNLSAVRQRRVICSVRDYKFKPNKQQVLLSYEVKEEAIYLLTFGLHENFYVNA